MLPVPLSAQVSMILRQIVAVGCSRHTRQEELLFFRHASLVKIATILTTCLVFAIAGGGQVSVSCLGSPYHKMSTGNFLNSGAESDPIALTAKVMGGDGMAKSCKMKGAIFTLDHSLPAVDVESCRVYRSNKHRACSILRSMGRRGFPSPCSA